MDYTQAITQAATQNGIDPNLALEVAIAESNLNPNAVSSAGAIGIMQLMPATAAQYGANPYDPLQNIDAGTSYLGDLLDRFGGNQVAALAAYDWGPGNVQNAMAKYGADWLSHAPTETKNYVAKILGNASTQYNVNIGPVPVPAGALNPSILPQYGFTAPVASLQAPAADSSGLWILLAIGVGIVIAVYFT